MISRIRIRIKVMQIRNTGSSVLGVYYYMVVVCRRMVCLLVGEEKVTEAERQLPCDLSKRGGGSSQ
jgi:hypothetical protein